ncbi:MAG TPA: SPOR domain-containing protein [Saprospiraceae bacterium]|nr:SPOR domain-containing protein [Saprospiraceae bacterium]HMQ85366.1 SPOR domain-containing protein [Saprospiraceae bacterium]
MQMDIGAYIGELLYEREVIHVPGLGAFVSKYKPAVIDQIQGQIFPPSKEISFDPNLVMDDGLLYNFIRHKHQLPASEAQSVLDDYIGQIRAAIDRREIVVFPRVGRLYKDYERKLQFLPDSTNFNTESFGLPTIEFYPVSRQDNGKAAAANSSTTPSKKAESKSDHAFRTGWSSLVNKLLNNSLVIAITLAVIVVAFTIFLLIDNQKATSTADVVPTARVNVRPTLQENSANEAIEDEDALQENAQGSDDASGGDETASLDSETPTYSPDQKYAIISIGVFGNEDNVQRLVKRIFEAGYEAYTEQQGKLTKVGIRTAYENEKELERILENVRDRFEPDAKVIKK